MSALLLIVGGGTGGHVYPGVAIAEAWRAEGGVVAWAGSASGLEARIAPARGIEFHPVEARRLKNAGALERARSLFAMPGAILRGRSLVRRLEPDVVIGVGGYVSGPVVLAAALGGWPCAIAEQNARAGLTNRLLARFVRRIFTAFPEVEAQMPPGKVRNLGNPVRPEIVAAAEVAEPAGRAQRVLVIGGSQGALALNEKLPSALAALRGQFLDLEVWHQTGAGKDAPVRAAYAAAGWPEARVSTFIDDVAEAFVWADLVVARAGATTVAELACVGRSALFVPFPFAADDHQAANAASLVEAGAALMERQETLDTERLVGCLSGLLEAPERLAEMGRRARARGRPEAAAKIVRELKVLMETRR